MRIRFLAACALLMTANLVAGSCDSAIYGSIDALYWKTSHSPIWVASRGRQDTPNQVVQQTYLKSDHEWGVRARIGYLCCDDFWDISYLYFKPTDSAQVNLGNYDRIAFMGTLGFDSDRWVTAVKDKIEFRYQNVDLRWGRIFKQTCRSSYYGYVNARWVGIDYKNEAKGVPQSDPSAGFFDFFRQHAEFNGGGLGIGMGGRVEICNGFGATAQLGFIGLIGQADIERQEHRATPGNIDLTTLDTNGQKWTHFVPGLDFRVGLNYTYQCVSLEVGYEINYYFDVIRASFDPVTPGSGSLRVIEQEAHNLGFGGPYIRLSAAY